MFAGEDQTSQRSLEDYFVDFTREILERMSARESTHGIRLYPKTRIVFNDNGWSEEFIIKKQYSELLLSVDASFRAQISSGPCVREHLTQGVIKMPQMSDSVGNPIPNPTIEQAGWFLVNTMVQPIIEIVEKYGTLNPTREQILETYSRHRSGWTSTTVEWNVTIPLMNFQSDLPDISFGTIKLTPISVDGKTLLWNSLFREMIDLRTFSGVNYVLFGSYSHDNRKALGNRGITAEAGRIITALRLLKAGGVGAPMLLEKTDMPPLSGNERGHPLNDYRVRDSGITYMLNALDLPQLTTLCERLKKVGASRGLDVALRRLNQGYSRDSQEDRILDATIALECALLYGVRDEFQYRLALRGAALLAKKRDPSSTASILRLMYDVRSKIVHDGKPVTDPKLQRKIQTCLQQLTPAIQPHEFISTCEELLRDILKTYLERLADGQNIEDINTMLERDIEKGLYPRTDEAS